MTLRYQPLRPADLEEIELREEDAQEVEQGGGLDLRPLYPKIRGHFALTARDQQGRIVGIFGIVQGGGVLSPWMLCTRLIENHRVEAYRQARRFLRVLLSEAPPRALLTNRIAKSSHSARRYVESLGFVVVPTAGAFDLFFHPDHV